MSIYIKWKGDLLFLNLEYVYMYKKPIAFCQVMLILILQLPFEEINSLQSEHFYVLLASSCQGNLTLSMTDPCSDCPVLIINTFYQFISMNN